MEVFSVKEWKFFNLNLIIIFGMTLVLCCRYGNKHFDSSMESHKITDSSRCRNSQSNTRQNQENPTEENATQEF